MAAAHNLNSTVAPGCCQTTGLLTLRGTSGEASIDPDTAQFFIRWRTEKRLSGKRQRHVERVVASLHRKCPGRKCLGAASLFGAGTFSIRRLEGRRWRLRRTRPLTCLWVLNAILVRSYCPWRDNPGRSRGRHVDDRTRDVRSKQLPVVQRRRLTYLHAQRPPRQRLRSCRHSGQSSPTQLAPCCRHLPLAPPRPRSICTRRRLGHDVFRESRFIR